MDRGADSLVLLVKSRGPSKFWWKDGPYKEKHAPLNVTERKHKDDIAAAMPTSKSSKPKAPTPARTPKAKAKPKTKSRKLTDEEKLELSVFGKLPEDIPMESISPEVLDVDGGRRGVKTDARVGDEPPLPPPYDPPEDPEDIIEILDPVGGADYYDEDFEVPPVVDFTKDEFGLR